MTMTLKNIVTLGIGALLFLVALVIIPQLFTNVDAKEITVIQHISGELSVVAEPGWAWQGMGKITHYPRRDQFSFSSTIDQGNPVDESIQTRFNDGGHANISGTINWAMPVSPDKVIRLHKDFGSVMAIEQQLMRTALQKVIYNVGPTMSSTESSAEKRPDIPKYINDQLVNGTYLTKTIQSTEKDLITGQDKTINLVTIALDEKGRPARESISQLTEYGLMLQSVAINQIKYDDAVENQIKERQKATTAVQISKANAVRAEQDKLTTISQGEANAAKAKWEQEVENAKTIATAQAKVTIADASVKEAEAFKKAEILRGEGEATRKRLVMDADGQMEKKLEAIVKINTLYADAIKSAQPGAWSPSIVMGGGGQANGGQNAANLVELMTAKTAKELGVDLSVRAGAATKK
jgi:regulator of protease activity HflC (stomatin/prohibitin superfamily)